MGFLFGFLMFVSSLFLILLVLVQRGRGGGLSGAFGGMGGQSAFGAKAGDTFTKVTIGTATVWILLCMIATGMLAQQKPKGSLLTEGGGGDAAVTQQVEDDLNVPVGGDAAAGGDAATGDSSTGDAATGSTDGAATTDATDSTDAAAPVAPDAGE